MLLPNDTFLQYDLGPKVTAFSTRRHGGVSKGNYATFNVNDYCGDHPDDVRVNRQLLCSSLGITVDRLVMPHQLHGIQVRLIDDAFLKMDDVARRQFLEGVDALITHETNICIGVSTADCIPVILYDPVHHVCGVAHAGWRGTVSRIVCHTLSTMQRHFSTQPQEIRAVIGPGISLSAFEVGQEVYDAFASEHFPMQRIAEKYDKWHIDLPLCIRLLLTDAGVPDEHIHDAAVCTYNNPLDYFSARRLGIHSGRILTAILIEN